MWLFRQRRLYDWADVFERLAQQLLDGTSAP
jgi:hypothetical protein